MNILISLLLFAAVTTSETNWPAFRGTGDSLTQVDNLPVEWSPESGVRWDVPLRGQGQSSPVVWGDRVYVTTFEGEQKETLLVTCLDLTTGGEQWQREFASSQLVNVSNYVSQAAPTPVVDPSGVFVFFESGDLIALTHEGEIRWQRSLTKEYGMIEGNHGLGCSPAQTAEALYLLIAHEGPCYLLAVDKQTGENRWKVDRPRGVSWSSPIIAPRGEGDQLVISSSGVVEGYDPATGEKLWSFADIEGNSTPSPTITEQYVVVGSDDTDGNLALRWPLSGELTEAAVAWRAAKAKCSFGSPLVHQGVVYIVNRSGVAFGLDLQTGEQLWTLRLSTSVWASPIGAGEQVYFFANDGTTTVIRSGPELETLAENTLPTETRVYGVAVVEDGFLIRTGDKLTRVGPAK